MALALVGASRESLASTRERLASAGLDAARSRAVAEDLFAFAELLYAEGGLRRALSDPAASGEAKKGLVDSLLGQRLGGDSLPVVHALVEARWSAPRDLVDVTELLGVDAVLASAEADGMLAEVEDELFRFQRILERSSDLQVALTDASVPVDARIRLLHDLLDDKAKPTTVRLVEEVIRAPRGRPLDRALDDFVRLAAERRSRLVAEVWSAVALTPEQEERLAAGLERQFGRAIALQVSVDRHLLGGLTVRVGDEVIEGSIATRLAEARRGITG
jgi:F-type H+-transporting ATPase subunit delta